jgi:hypothetical protein
MQPQDKHINGDFEPRDLSGDIDEQKANNFVKSLNKNSFMHTLLGQGRMLVHTQRGDRHQRCKIGELTPEMKDTMLMYESTGPKDTVTSNIDLAVQTSVFCPDSRISDERRRQFAKVAKAQQGRSLHALYIIEQAAVVMKMLTEQVNEIACKWDQTPNIGVKSEMSLSRAIKEGWRENAKSKMFGIKAEVSPDRANRIDITVWVHIDYEETNIQPKSIEKTEYVVQVELKIFGALEPTPSTRPFNDLCTQITTYVLTSINQKKLIPVAFMLLYIVIREVKSSGGEDTGKQVHGFWWPTVKQLFVEYKKKHGLDQERWGHDGARILDYSPGDEHDSDVLPLEDDIVQEPRSPVRPRKSPRDDGGGGSARQATVRPMNSPRDDGGGGSARQATVRPRKSPGDDGGGGSARQGLRTGTNEDDADPRPKRKKSSIRKESSGQDSSGEEDTAPQKSKAKPAPRKKTSRAGVKPNPPNFDPGKYMKGGGIEDETQYHFLDPTYLKGIFCQKRVIEYDPGLDWKLKTIDFDSISKLEEFVIPRVSMVSAQLQLAYRWVAIQYRASETSYEKDEIYLKGRWIIGRIVEVLPSPTYIKLVVEHPGYKPELGGRVMLGIKLPTSNAVDNSRRDAKDGKFTVGAFENPGNLQAEEISEDWTWAYYGDMYIFNNYGMSYTDIFHLDAIRLRTEETLTRNRILSESIVLNTAATHSDIEMSQMQAKFDEERTKLEANISEISEQLRDQETEKKIMERELASEKKRAQAYKDNIVALGIQLSVVEHRLQNMDSSIVSERTAMDENASRLNEVNATTKKRLEDEKSDILRQLNFMEESNREHVGRNQQLEMELRDNTDANDSLAALIQSTNESITQLNTALHSTIRNYQRHLHEFNSQTAGLTATIRGDNEKYETHKKLLELIERRLKESEKKIRL